MGEYENVTMDMIYEEIINLKKEVRKLERMLVPEIELSKEEMEELEKLKKEAKQELKEGKLIPLREL